jgi:hypothetical protein
MTILMIAIIIALPVINFLLAGSRIRKNSIDLLEAKESDTLHLYKHFLYDARKSITELKDQIAAVNYNQIPYDTFFTALELAVLKNEINKEIGELENKLLVQAISTEDFDASIIALKKRADLLTLPLTRLHFALGDQPLKSKAVA